jgi:hypothetical protein
MMASKRQSIHHALVRMAVIAGAVALTGCGERDTGDNNAAAVSATSPTPTASTASLATKLFSRKGPDMLSTVGLYEGEPLKEVDAAEGKVTIQPVDGLDTLMVDGKPARYLDAGIQGRPVDVAANSGLSLVGVFELPGESVAWAIITGGSACPGTHVLVPIRDGAALPGQSLPGCDDRGTMRLADDRIVFEAGGSNGFYQNGLVSLENPPMPM